MGSKVTHILPGQCPHSHASIAELPLSRRNQCPVASLPYQEGCFLKAAPTCTLLCFASMVPGSG